MALTSPGQYYRGAKIAQVPNASGLYAWYYKPRLPYWPDIRRQLNKLLDAKAPIETVTTLRYGVQLRGTAIATIRYQGEDGGVAALIAGLDVIQQDAVMKFLTDDTFLMFSRPLYIGITNTLNRRVYTQHYSILVDYWDDANEVNRYMLAEPDATAEQMIAALGVKRSFALEARSRNIAPGDLIVYACPTTEFMEVATEDDEASEEGARRGLERVLHLLSDPICGRR